MNEFDTPSAAHPPAPYGRACTSCARAKARCAISKTVGAKCERCNRLDKDCHPPAGARKRRTVNNTPSAKAARLEEKLDGLVSLLKSTSKPNLEATHPTPRVAPSIQSQSLPESYEDNDTTSRSVTNSNRPVDTGSDALLVTDHPLRGNQLVTWSVVTPPASYTTSSSQDDHPSRENAEEFFQVFQTLMLENLPFFRFPPSMTAGQLQNEQPFLWLCIMAVASDSSSQKRALGREIRITLGREVWLESRNRIDIILGLLTYLNWGNHHFSGKPIVSHSIALCNSMLGALGLHKSPPKESHQLMLEFNARGCPVPPNSGLRTLDERRTALGCFVISSEIALYFQKTDSPRWTPYLEECLRLICENQGDESDQLLIQLIRLQLIREKIFQAPWHTGAIEEACSTKPSSVFYLRALASEVQDFRNNIPIELQQNETLLLTLYDTELIVHEFGLSKVAAIPSGPDFQKLESLHACLMSLKRWFNLFLSISPALYVGFSQKIYMQLAHCTTAMNRLAVHENPEWDKALVRQTLNLPLILGHLVEKFAVVKLAAKLDCDSAEDNDIYSGISRRIASLKALAESRMAPEMANTNPVMNGTDETILDAAANPTSYVNFQDDAWLNDLLSFGEYLFEPFF